MTLPRILFILLKINILQITLVRGPHSRIRTTNRNLLYLTVCQYLPQNRMFVVRCLHGDVRREDAIQGAGGELLAHMSSGEMQRLGGLNFSVWLCKEYFCV